jgi:hypothetical protein
MLAEFRRHVSWRGILIAWFVSSTIFLFIIGLIMPLGLSLSTETVLRYFGALILGTGVLTEQALLPVLVGIVVHYVLAGIFSLLLIFLLHRWGFWVGVVGGAVLGAALYSINLYTLTVFFQWFFAINNPTLFIGHIIFGALVGGIYELLDTYDLPLAKDNRHDASA